MLEKLRNFSLKDLFRRKALPPVPQEYLDDKRVRKAVRKYESKRSRRKLRNLALASVTLSTALQFAPDLTSTRFDDYMAKQGSASNLSEHFHAREIRVYDRRNPLYPFHLAGHLTATSWIDGLRNKESGVIGLTLTSPLIYLGGLGKGFGDVIFPGTIDAYSIANDDVPQNRTNYIRPPAQFTLDEFLQEFTGYDHAEFKFKNAPEDLRRVMFEFIMLHEARHGDQDKKAYGNANESDADVYAFRVMKARGGDPALLDEAAAIIRHVRALHGAAGDAGHVSTFALPRNGSSILEAHQDAASFSRLTSLLGSASTYNKDIFPEGMKRTTRFYHLTLAMQREGMMDRDAGMKKAADAFIAAFRFFDGASAGALAGPDKFDGAKISFGQLTKKYQPVPDKGMSQEKPQEQKAKKPAKGPALGA